MKKLFIAGCSYTNWRDGDCFGESYPALIAKEYPNWHVYDASECGSANDSVYLRLRHFEKLYGTPDAIIVQWTHLKRTTVALTNDDIPRDFNHATVGNYTFCEQSDIDFPSVTVGPTSFIPNQSVRRQEQWKQLSTYTMLRLVTLAKFYSWFLNSRTLFWNTQKEIDLVNAVYGKGNVLMYDWQEVSHHGDLQQSPGSRLTLPSNWIGSVADALAKDNKFMQLGVDDAPHYGVEGHLEVYKWLMPHLNKLLT